MVPWLSRFHSPQLLAGIHYVAFPVVKHAHHTLQFLIGSPRLAGLAGAHFWPLHIREYGHSRYQFGALPL
jgi:hypothetical protein